MLANLLTLPRTKQKAATTLLCDDTQKKGTLPNQSLHVSPELLDQLVDTSLRGFCLRCVPLALGQPLVFYVFNGMRTAQRFHMEGEE